MTTRSDNMMYLLSMEGLDTRVRTTPKRPGEYMQEVVEAPQSAAER